MLVEAELRIQSPRAAVWAAITDIENAASTMRGIEKIELVEKPASGLVGLRWRETRILFGEPATVEKWITAAVDEDFYTTRAEEGGFAFVTTMRISGSDGRVVLASSHETTPLGLAARVKAIPMFLFRGTIRKAILQDLEDVRLAVERSR